MSDDFDPPRLRSNPDALSPDLRGLLAAMDDSLPSPRELAGLDERMRTLIAPPAVAAASTIKIAKIGALIVTVILGAAGLSLWGGGFESPRPLDSRHAIDRNPGPNSDVPLAVASPSVEPTSSESPSAIDAAGESTVTSEQDEVRRIASRPTRRVHTLLPAEQSEAAEVPITSEGEVEIEAAEAPEPTVDLEVREARILWSARRMLRDGNAAQALRFAQDHERAFPNGALMQEREAIVIEAIALLGRREDARARFERFRREYPDSTYRPALERALGP